jgi:prohibitin 1
MSNFNFGNQQSSSGGGGGSAPEFNVKRIRSIVIAVVLVIVVIFTFSKASVTIESGHMGVLYSQFGGGVDADAEALGAGFHIIAPWNHVIVYEVRQQEESQAKMPVLSKNLLDIKLDITVLFEPMKSKLGYLEIEKGKDYQEKFIVPSIRSVTREVIANYLPEEINTTKREQIIEEIRTQVSLKLADHYVQLTDVLIRNIELPANLRESIERKLQQEQESLEYEFRIEKASKEAERMKIEAEGVRKFQEIVTQSITPDLLKWKGIEATIELAKSPNSKVVVIGGGDGGMPLILGGQ